MTNCFIETLISVLKIKKKKKTLVRDYPRIYTQGCVIQH